MILSSRPTSSKWSHFFNVNLLAKVCLHFLPLTRDTRPRAVTSNDILRFKILTAVKMAMFLWVVTTSTLIGRYKSFGETYCIHLQG
jgi:hypothetical protein